VACDSLFAYEGRGRTVVVSLKYRNRRDAAAVLGRGMAALVEPSDIDVVTWAPTTGARRARRGYDQSRLLARAVARALHRPCRRLLRRTGGAAQTGRALDDRLIGPSFAVVATPPARVLVVDDVVTTGSTLCAVARSLHTAGTHVVLGLTAARTPLKVALAHVENNNRHDPPVGLGRSPHPHEVAPHMQVTELQVQRSLQALNASPPAARTTARTAADDVPEGLVERLAVTPAVRDDRLAEACERLETGEQPSADDLAGRMVGRLVCDRLR
jgi:hypothetical protein